LTAGHDGGARVGSQQRRQDADEGGLARPVRPEQGVDLAGGHGQVNAVEDDLGAERPAEAGCLYCVFYTQ
jgi:hypothetical protein